MDDDQAGDEYFYSFSPLMTLGGIALLDSEKAEAFADNLEAQFQPVTDSSVPALIEIVNVALCSYFLSPSSEHQLNNPDEVHEAIRGLKVSKVPGPNGIPKIALKYLPRGVVPSSPYLQCGSPYPSIFTDVEARSSDLYL